MKDFDVIKLVTEVLSPLAIPVFEGWYDKELNETHITVHEYLETEEGYEDDNASEVNHNLQIDIWSKKGTESFRLKREVKRLLKESGFIFDSAMDDYEEKIKLWHKAIRVSYIEFL